MLLLSVERGASIAPRLLSRSLSSSCSLSSPRVAVILSGSGVYDGSEVHEAAACLSALTRAGATPVVFAPDVKQEHVVDHQTGQEAAAEARSVLSEAARIARGAVTPLAQLKASSDIKALVFPGGFGAAKNLSDFGFKGTDMSVNPDVARVITEFHSSKKPIALCCIAPILAAKVLGKTGVEITMGRKGDEKLWPYGGALEAASAFGAKVVEKNVDEVCVDSKNKVITTPAFMFNGQFHQIHDGVAKMIEALIKMIH